MGKSDLILAHIAVQFALRRWLLRALASVQRVADHSHSLLLPPPALVGSGRNAPRPDPDGLLAAYAGWLGQRLQDCCLSLSDQAALEADALDEIFLGLRLRWLRECAVLGYLRQRAEGPEGLGEVPGLAVVLQLLLDGFQSRRRSPLLVLKLLGKSPGVLALLAEVSPAAVGLFFMKRLAALVLRPALDFLLGDALDYFSLVEERQALEVVLAGSADQGLYRRFLAHEAMFLSC